MSRLALVFVLILAFHKITLAEKYALFVGGGGEITENLYTYQQGSDAMYKALQEGGYQIKTIFNGVSEYSTQRLKDMGAKKIEPFNADNVESAIEEYANLINSGKIKSGDQIFVALMSHGSPQDGEETHSLYTNKFSKGTFEKLSLDKLKILANLASSKGIKIAIADGSCFSGPSLNLAKKNTCVISASGKDAPSLFGMSFERDPEKRAATQPFIGHLGNKLKPGKSLMTSFLDSRKIHNFSYYPSISDLKDFSDGFFNQASLVTQAGGKILIETERSFSLEQPKFCHINESDLEALKNSTAKLHDQMQDIQIKQEVEKLQSLLEGFGKKQKALANEHDEKIIPLKDKKISIGNKDYSVYDLASSATQELVMAGYRCVTFEKAQPIMRFFWPSEMKEQCKLAKPFLEFFKGEENRNTLNLLSKDAQVIGNYTKNLIDLANSSTQIAKQERLVFDLLARQLTSWEFLYHFESLQILT